MHRSASKASSSSSVVTKAVPVEVAQMAGEAGFIAGTAFTMFGVTLVVSAPLVRASATALLQMCSYSDR